LRFCEQGKRTKDEGVNHEHFQAIRSRFNRYVARFRGPDGAFPAMQALKRRHTSHVVADAGRVMAAEGWTLPQVLLGRTAALLHDIGRFSQYAEFGTFQDSASVNHAERGCAVMLQEGICDGLPEDDERIIFEAVRQHNGITLPPDTAADAARIAYVVRDADKLDIFRVMEEAVESGQLEHNPEITWNLQLTGGVSEPMLAALDAGHAINYRDVTTFCDFVMVQVSWLSGQLHYAASRRLARERRVLEYRECLVLARCDDPRVSRYFQRFRDLGGADA
jgi:hypothetical protein